MTQPLTTTEVAEVLGVSWKTVLRRAEAGELVFIRKLPGRNGGYLFDASVIAQYMKTGAPAADEDAASLSA